VKQREPVVSAEFLNWKESGSGWAKRYRQLRLGYERGEIEFDEVVDIAFQAAQCIGHDQYEQAMNKLIRNRLYPEY